MFASQKLFVDDNPIPVLDQAGAVPRLAGCGSTPATIGLGMAGSAAAVYLYSPDRKAERPASIWPGFKGTVQVDGYPASTGFAAAATSSSQVLGSRQTQFYEVQQATGSPVAAEALGASPSSMRSRPPSAAMPPARDRACVNPDHCLWSRR